MPLDPEDLEVKQAFEGVNEIIRSIQMELNAAAGGRPTPGELASLYMGLGQMWEKVKVVMAFMNRSFCSYCGHETALGGLSDEERSAQLLEHITTCEKRPEVRLLPVALAAIRALESFNEGGFDAGEFGSRMFDLKLTLDKAVVVEKKVVAKG